MKRKGSPYRRFRLTKVVATLGPASSTPEMIRSLFEAGVDVFRLNFSHGSHEDHGERLRAIRALEEETGRTLDRLVALITPAVTLLLGGVVAGMVVALLSAVLSVNEVAL